MTLKQKPNMQTHARAVHSVEKKHKCETCGKYFSQKSNMKNHVQAVHSVEKKHICETCGK